MTDDSQGSNCSGVAAALCEREIFRAAVVVRGDQLEILFGPIEIIE
jgi:hypothetical protein